MKFVNLADADPSMSPAERQQQAAERFETLVRQSTMKLFTRGESGPSRGVRLVIGVAPAWNGYDRLLLDLIDTKLTENPRDDLVVEVFDSDSCESPAELGQYIPGIESATAWPLLGIWEDGRHTESLWGLDARQRILSLLEIASDEFGNPVHDVPMTASQIQ